MEPAHLDSKRDTAGTIIGIQFVYGLHDPIIGSVSTGGSRSILGSQDLAVDAFICLLHQGVADSHISICDDELDFIWYHPNHL